jgi:PadR family transcriptional regulator, regulatory protein PadR
MLGEFEYLLITAAGLGENAYGAAIREEIESTMGRKCSIAAHYTTIDRLETKGLLKTWMGEATPERGGRAKRMVRVTPEGVRAAKTLYDAITAASRGASWAMKRARTQPISRSVIRLLKLDVFAIRMHGPVSFEKRNLRRCSPQIVCRTSLCCRQDERDRTMA